MDQITENALAGTESPSNPTLLKQDEFVPTLDGISFATVEEIRTPQRTNAPLYKAENIAFKISTHPQSSDTKTKDVETLLASSCTSSPYFAIKNLEIISKKTVKATIPIETSHFDEAGIITAAEIGRHLAILGTCSANLINKDPGKHYYLATKAELNILDDNFFKGTEIELTATGTAFELDKRRTLTKTHLYRGGTRVFTLSVIYTILPEKTFKKLFENHRIPLTEVSTSNPYINPLKLDTYYFGSNELFAQLSRISPEDCLGHFENYPALPVAVVMGNLSHCAGLLLQKTVGTQTKYQISYADVSAENLAFANDILSIKISLMENYNNTYFFLCTATNQDNLSIGKLLLEMKAINE